MCRKIVVRCAHADGKWCIYLHVIYTSHTPVDTSNEPRFSFSSCKTIFFFSFDTLECIFLGRRPYSSCRRPSICDVKMLLSMTSAPGCILKLINKNITYVRLKAIHVISKQSIHRVYIWFIMYHYSLPINLCLHERGILHSGLVL